MKLTNYRRAALIAAGIAFAVSGASAQSAKRPQKQYSIEQFMNTVSVNGSSFSPDESRILFSSNKTGIWNAYTIPVTGGEWTPVTTSTGDSTFAVAYFPDDERILFTRDQGGNELNHLYVRTPDGQERDLTPGEKLKASFSGFTPDGSAFYVQSNKRDPRFFDIYRYDAKTYEPTLFYQNEGYFPSAVSDDGKWVSLTKVITTTNTDVYLWSAETKEVKHLTPHTGNAQASPSSFDRASKYLTTRPTMAANSPGCGATSLRPARTKTSRKPNGMCSASRSRRRGSIAAPPSMRMGARPSASSTPPPASR